MGFPGDSDGKEFTCNAGDLDSIPGLRRSPEGGHGNPLQYSCLENPHGQRILVGYSPRGHKKPDTTEWPSTQHISNNMQCCFPGGSVIKNPSAKQETQVRSLGQEEPMKKEMVIHSSIPAWEISWTERSLTSYSPWCCKESDRLSDKQCSPELNL